MTSTHELRQKILEMIKNITDPQLRTHAELAFKAYLRTRSLLEKKVYRERIITFYGQWLSQERVPKSERKELIALLKRLLLAIRK